MNQNLVHYFKVLVYKKSESETPMHVLLWNDLRFDLRMKYDWYFKYRAALLQVKYPKAKVECRWGHYEAKGDQLKITLKNKIKSKKAKITHTLNKLRIAEKSWDELFPIEEDPLYPKVQEKLQRLNRELIDLEKQYDEISKQQN